MTAWAERTPEVVALVLIGSRERQVTDDVWRADAESDWDFQIVTTEPEMFLDSSWTRDLPGTELRTYAARIARIGGVPKITALFKGTEADFVVVPAGWLRRLKIATMLGWHRRDGKVRRSLQDLAVVIRPGWRFLKGGAGWERFYRRVIAEVADARLGDAEAQRLADAFTCDRVWTLRKLARGELVAAQRMLHQGLAETNFRLLHELRLRRGERSFPEARRIERLVSDTELAMVGLNATLEEASLRAAVGRCATTCEALMGALLGGTQRANGS